MVDFEHLVIGGGITGLVSAYALSKNSRSVGLIEPEHLGGVLRSKELNGFTLEEGPNVLTETEDLRLLIDDLGLRSAVCYPRVTEHRHYVWHGQAITSFPKGPLDLLKTPLFSVLEKARLLRVPFIKGKLGPELEDQSVAEIFRPLLGIDGVTKLVDPVLRGIYGGDVSRLSARSVTPKLWAHMKSGRSLLSLLRTKNGNRRPRIFVLKGGNSLLVNALVERIENSVHRENDRAVSVEMNCNHFMVGCENGRVLSGKHVWVTTAGPYSAGLLNKIDAGLAERLNRLPYSSITVVHVAVPAQLFALPSNCFGVLFPTKESKRVMAAMCNSNMFPHVAPKDRQLLTLFLNAKVDVSEPIEVEVQSILHHFFGITGGEVFSTRTWKRATPQLEVGHYELLKMFDIIEAKYQNLHFIGSDRGSLGVPGRVGAALRSTLPAAR